MSLTVPASCLWLYSTPELSHDSFELQSIKSLFFKFGVVEGDFEFLTQKTLLFVQLLFCPFTVEGLKCLELLCL